MICVGEISANSLWQLLFQYRPNPKSHRQARVVESVSWPDSRESTFLIEIAWSAEYPETMSLLHSNTPTSSELIFPRDPVKETFFPI